MRSKALWLLVLCTTIAVVRAQETKPVEIPRETEAQTIAKCLRDLKSDDVEALREGMDLIYKKLMKALEGLGVKPIDAVGKEFDVDFHEAIAMVPGMGDDKKGKVIDCVQTGYTINDKVIRHAKVAVGQ